MKLKKHITENIGALIFNIKTAYSKRGSTAIILSLIVSGAVLSTIFVTQQTAEWFLSGEDRNLDDWQSRLVAKTALTIGGYAISNNLILCKEAGWSDTDALCRWNDKNLESEGDAPKPSSVKLSSEALIDQGEGANKRKVLSYLGDLSQIADGNSLFSHNDNVPKFRITFDLVNWEDSSVKELIGDIPNTICRNKQSLALQEGKCSKADADRGEKCTDTNGDAIANTVCENVSDMDGDRTIVLMSVQVPGDAGPNEAKAFTYAGIRRPLAIPVIKVKTAPVCRLSCASSDSDVTLPECRGAQTPNSKNSISTLEGDLYNPGPGPIYSLYIVKKVAMVNPDPDGTLPPPTFEVIGDLVTLGDREVIMPGQKVTFRDYVDCQDSVINLFSQRTYTRRRSTSGRVRRGTLLSSSTSSALSINMHSEPLLSLSYHMGSMQNAEGVCMMEEDGNLKKDTTAAAGACTSEGQACGNNGGVCKYPQIEPARTLGTISTGPLNVERTTTTNRISFITVRVIATH